jgi:uncharacterized membrane protein
MTKQITPAFSLLPKSIEVIRDNLLTYFVLSVLPVLLFNLAAINETSLADILGSPFYMTGSLLGIIFYAPLVYAMTKTSEGKKVDLNEAFSKGFPYFLRLMGLGILAALIIFVGLLLLIVPGVIMIRRYFLSAYYLVDQDLGIRQAMNKSATESKANSGAIYGVLGVMLLFGIIGIMPLIGPIVSAILAFLYSLAPALRYHEIKGSKN